MTYMPVIIEEEPNPPTTNNCTTDNQSTEQASTPISIIKLSTPTCIRPDIPIIENPTTIEEEEFPIPSGMVDIDDEFTTSTTTEKEEDEKSSNNYYDTPGLTTSDQDDPETSNCYDCNQMTLEEQQQYDKECDHYNYLDSLDNDAEYFPIDFDMFGDDPTTTETTPTATTAGQHPHENPLDAADIFVMVII